MKKYQRATDSVWRKKYFGDYYKSMTAVGYNSMTQQEEDHGER